MLETAGQMQNLENQNREICEVGFVVTDDDKIMYFPITKKRFFHKLKGKYVTLFKQNFAAIMTELKQVCQAAGITALAIPGMGCGVDRLSWGFAGQVIYNVFHVSGIQITVYTLQHEQNKFENTQFNPVTLHIDAKPTTTTNTQEDKCKTATQNSHSPKKAGSEPELRKHRDVQTETKTTNNCTP